MALAEQREKVVIFFFDFLCTANQFRTGISGHINDGIAKLFNVPLLQYRNRSVRPTVTKCRSKIVNSVIEGIWSNTSLMYLKANIYMISHKAVAVIGLTFHINGLENFFQLLHYLPIFSNKLCGSSDVCSSSLLVIRERKKKRTILDIVFEQVQLQVVGG